MKKLGIMVIALALLAVGMAMADPGINAVSETQTVSTSTTVIGMGNFNQASSVALTTITGNSLSDIPAGLDSFRYYTTVYTEDTQNSENGYLSYDKDLDVNTGNMLLGQYNVQAVKQITYVGIDASSVISTDYMMLDGAGEDYGTGESLSICPFASDKQAASLCNVVETGSSVNLKIANMNTQLAERFIMKSADPGVTVTNSIGVSSYATDVPSVGSASAYIQGSIKEGRAGDGAENLYETMTFSDKTAFAGQITSFAKGMVYTSKITG